MTAGPSVQPLMQLCNGFWAFKALAGAHEIGVFDILAEQGPLTPTALGEALDVAERPAEMLLTACTSLGLTDKRDAGYVNSELADTYLVSGREHYFGGWVEYSDQHLYPGWGRLTESVRSNKPATWDAESSQDDLFDITDTGFHATFQQAMHSLTSNTGAHAAEHLDLSGHRRLLDVGGGTGAFAIELCRAYPELRATVFDRPEVAAPARERLADAQLGDRIDYTVGDFFADRALPGGHDAILLSLILHDWDPQQCRELVSRCVEALQPGGQLIICELLVDDAKTGPTDAALMSLNMLIETWGRNYTAAEYSEWLEEAGLTHVHTRRFDAPSANGAVIGTKPV